uniref:LITAF domain-containing protein n=1 Tax=Angiostrongylus cantonensis TaxID=6313 RepID=A0A0K0DDS0_ANGCA
MKKNHPNLTLMNPGLLEGRSSVKKIADKRAQTTQQISELSHDVQIPPKWPEIHIHPLSEAAPRRRTTWCTACTWQLTESGTVHVIRAERILKPEGSEESSGEGSGKPDEGSGDGSGDVDVPTTGEGSAHNRNVNQTMRILRFACLSAVFVITKLISLTGGEASGENIENNAVTDKPTLLAFF